MHAPFPQIQRELNALRHAAPRDASRHIRALQKHLLTLFRATHMPTVGDVHLYGAESMEPNADVVGHAFLLDHNAVVAVRLTLPDGAGHGGTVRCGDPSAPIPAADLERMWRQDAFPAEPSAFPLVWGATSQPTPSAGPSLVRALGRLTDLGDTLAVPLPTVWEALIQGRPSGISSSERDAFVSAVGAVLTAIHGEATPAEPAAEPAWQPPPPPRETTWQPPPERREQAWQPPPPRRDPPWQPPPDRAADPEPWMQSREPPPRSPWDGEVMDVDFDDLSEPAPPRGLPGPRDEG